MPAAALPADEKLRLAVLQSLDLLDTPREDIFDRVVRLAAHLLNVPIALFSLVDADRQWVKAGVGLDVQETPRDWAFCAHALSGGQPLIVNDALGDSRFADNPLVLGEPYIRFYAGVPIASIGGQTLGTLCAMDREPRAMSARQIEVLQDLGALIQREIAQRESVAVARSVSQEALGALNQTQAFFQVIFEQAATGMAMVSLDGNFSSVNRKLADIVGYTTDELIALTFQQITHPDDLNRDLDLVNQLLRGEATQYQLEKRYLRKDGGLVWIDLNVSLVRNGEGRPQYFVAVIQDIHARKQAQASLQALRRDLEDRVEQRTASLQAANDLLTQAIQQRTASEAALRANEAELRAVLEHANDAYICIDHAGTILGWNRQAEVMFGWSCDEAIGLCLEETIIPAGLRAGHVQGLDRVRRTGTSKMFHQRIELTASTRDGRTLSVEMSLYPLPAANLQRYCAFLHDITERKALQQSLEDQLRRDALTGLPNRRELMELLPQVIGRTRRSGRASAVLFMDLDGFKAVNDQLGHQAGDELLRQIAQRLKACLRSTDTPARLSGDEFVVLAEFVGDAEPQAQCLVDKIEKVIDQPFDLMGLPARVGVSIGLTLCRPDSMVSAEELLSRADQAMYMKKRARKARLEVPLRRD